MRWRLIVGAAVAAFVSLVSVASAPAVTRWAKSRALAPDVAPRLTASAVQATSAGVVAAWAGNSGVFAAVAGRDRRFRRRVRLSRHAVWNDDARLLAANPRGDAVVVWQQEYRREMSPGSLFVAFRPAGGRFGAAKRVARNVGRAVMAIDGAGDATIAWDQLASGRGTATIKVVVRRKGGTYGRVQTVASGSVGVDSVAVDARGDAVLVWEQGRFPQTAIIAATRTAQGQFAAPVTAAPPSEGGVLAQVALDAVRDATIAWEGPYDAAASGSPFVHIEVTSLHIGASTIGAVSELVPRRLGPPATFPPVLSVDPAGDALLAWQNETVDGSDDVIVAARRRAGEQFTIPVTVGHSYPGGNFDAAMGPTGAAIVSWDSLSTPIQAVIATNPAKPFQRTGLVAPRSVLSAAPAVTIDSHARATELWWDLGPAKPRSGVSPSPLLYTTTSHA